MERALAAVEDALRAGQRVVSIAGPAGFGKTLLLRVLGARGAEPGRFVYVPFLALPAAEMARWLLGLLGEGASGERLDESALLARLQARREGAGPTILLVDEAQAIPTETAERLGGLARRAGDALQLVLAGVESMALDAVLERFPVQPLCVPLRAPLTEDDVERALTQMLEIAAEERETEAVAWLGSLDGADLLRASGGVPCEFRSEMLRRWLGLGDTVAVEQAASAERSEHGEPAEVDERTEATESPAGDDRGEGAEPQGRHRQPDIAKTAPPPRAVAEPVSPVESGRVSAARAWLLEVARTGAQASRAARSRGFALVAVGSIAAFGLGLSILGAEEPSREIDAPVLTVSAPQVAGSPAVALPSPVSELSEPSAAPAEMPGASAPSAVTLETVLVNVNAFPWARIRVDGRELGATPLGNLPLTPGPHRFEAELSDGRVMRRLVEVGSNERLVSFR
jgi:hypothetical protein